MTATIDEILVESLSDNIKTILIYDLLGRELYKVEDINANYHSISNLIATHQTLIVKAILENGMIETKKILH